MEVSVRIVEFLKERGISAFFPPELLESYGLHGKAQSVKVEDWGDKVDFVVVLGGDGTLLGACRFFAPLGIPLLGVNLGHFGFLTEIEGQNLLEELSPFLEGCCERDRRTLMRVEVIRKGEMMFQGFAMNEAGIVKGPYGRMTTLTLHVRGEHVDTYFADGIIVATPTGSTAYSLSAGGPIVAPSLDAFLVTPICPHTLYSRSILVPQEEPCEVSIEESSQSTMLAVDGQEFFSLETGDRVRCTNSGLRVDLLRRRDWSFYDVLRRKMKEAVQPRFPDL